MTSETRPRFSFGPSERYLPGKKLEVGDVLTMNILDCPTDWRLDPEDAQVETEYGSKWELSIILLSSSNSAIGVGPYTWRTVCRQVKALIQSVRKYEVNVEAMGTWVFRLTVKENGYDLDEVA